MPSATHRISRFPRGSTLRCTSCGKQGTVGQITGHTAKSHECKGARVEIVSPPPGLKHVAVPVHQARVRPPIQPLPPLPPEPQPDEFAAPAEEPTDPDDEPPEDDEDEDEDEEDVAELVTEATSRRTAAGGKATPPRRPRLGRRPILRPGAPGAARVEEPAPTIAKFEIELWVSNAARFDAVRYDPDLAFEGTLTDFINEVLEVHFTECLGLHLQMTRRRVAVVA